MPFRARHDRNSMEKTRFVNFYGVREAKNGKGLNVIFVAGEGKEKTFYSCYFPLAGKNPGAKAFFSIGGDGKAHLTFTEVWKPLPEKKEPRPDKAPGTYHPNAVEDPEGAAPVGEILGQGGFDPDDCPF